MELLRITLKFKNCLAIYCRGLSGGLCLLWSDDVIVDVRSFYANHIDCNISWGNIPFKKKKSWGNMQWHFSGIYGCSEGQFKHVTWELMRRLAN